jgi:hypothetical protein
MPVRKVFTHGGNAVGRFPSIKMKRMIAFESLLERDFIYLLDYDPSVEWFEEQPLAIEYVHVDKTLHYTPDFHIIEADKEHPFGQHVLVECKPERFVDTDENYRKFAIAQAWCQERGWQFRTATEQQIRFGYRLQNVKLLTQYARQRVDPVLHDRILSFLSSTELSVSIQNVAEEIFPCNPEVITASLLHMAYHHRVILQIDLASISGKSSVSLLTQISKEIEQ